MSQRRPIVTPKRKLLPETRPGEDPLAELLGDMPTVKQPAADAVRKEWERQLDQPTGIDPFHPHMLTKPSIDPPADIERLKQLIIWYEATWRSEHKVTAEERDTWKHSISALGLRLGNRLQTNDDQGVFS